MEIKGIASGESGKSPETEKCSGKMNLFQRLYFCKKTFREIGKIHFSIEVLSKIERFSDKKISQNAFRPNARKIFGYSVTFSKIS